MADGANIPTVRTLPLALVALGIATSPRVFTCTSAGAARQPPLLYPPKPTHQSRNKCLIMNALERLCPQARLRSVAPGRLRHAQLGRKAGCHADTACA